MGRPTSSSDAAKRLEAATQNKLLIQLRTILNQKPKETSPVSIHDEFHVKLKELYIEIISRFPVFAVDNKLELEMWNNLYKTHIDALQQVLHSHQSTSTNAVGQSRNLTKVKLQFLLLLDRASGVYFTLIQRLLHSIPDTSWPKSIIAAATSYAAPIGMHKFDRLGRTSGRFDLDLATFSALHHFRTTVSQGALRCLSDEQEQNIVPTVPVAPRILSRGDRLPSNDVVPRGDSALVSESAAAPVNQARDTPQNGIYSPVSTPSVDRDTAVNYLTQHCLVHLGDVARYRHQINVATGFYLWAWIVHPESGHPFNQLAILESSKVPRTPLDASLYHYIRAIACRYPFPAANTNLKNLLRTHFAKSQSSKLNEFLNTSATQPVHDICQLLTDLHVAIFLETDSSLLVSLANQFILSSSSPDPVWSAPDDRRLLRLVTVHVYLLATHFENYSEESSQPEDGYKKIGTTRILLLHSTVALIDWLAAQYLNECSNLTPNKRCLLSCLVLLLLWLRLQTTCNSVSMDAVFRTYAPPLSENTILFFNELLYARPISVGEHPSSAEALTSLHMTSCELDWLELLRLPELSVLEGFKPLQIPTQHHLVSVRGHSPSFPFLNGLQPHDLLLDIIQPPNHPPLSINGFVDSGIGVPLQTASERVRFILCCARIIAHHFPALLSWTEELSKDTPNASLSLNGRFLLVKRPTPVLSELIPLPSTKPSKVVQTFPPNAQLLVNATENLVTDALPASLLTDQNATVDSINQDLPSSSSSSEQCLKAGNADFVDSVSPGNTAPDFTSTYTMNQNGNHSQPTSSSQSLPDASLSPSKNVSALSTSTSGGLIVNAELAKFIQEQASQVAARQQLAGISSGVCITDADSRNNSGQHATTSGATIGKCAKLRPFMSTSFRRDLPPRFARRLQAELLEREALEQRLGNLSGADSDSHKLNICSLSALSLDKPAPLARKESEAPYELNSLLSSADPVHSPTGPSAYGGLESPQLPATSFITPQLPTNSTLLQPFVNSYQNASLNVASRTYPMRPLAFYQPHSISLTSTHPPSVHESTTFPISSTMFGNPQHTGPSPLLDWRTRVAGFTPVQSGEYHTTTHFVVPPLPSFSTSNIASGTDTLLGGHPQCAENGSHPMHEDSSHFANAVTFHGTSDQFCQGTGFMSTPNGFTADMHNSNCVSQSMWLDHITVKPKLNSTATIPVDVEQPFKCADVP